MPVKPSTTVHKTGSPAIFGEITITQGANMTITQTGNDIAFASTGGGGGGTWTETEIDFGSVPVRDKTFVITDAGVSGTSKMICVPSGNVATGRVGNDLEWDNLMLGGIPGTGQFTLTALALPGPIVGKRKIFYQIGT